MCACVCDSLTKISLKERFKKTITTTTKTTTTTTTSREQDLWPEDAKKQQKSGKVDEFAKMEEEVIMEMEKEKKDKVRKKKKKSDAEKENKVRRFFLSFSEGFVAFGTPATVLGVRHSH